MLNLQDASCYLMEQLMFFHDHAMFFLVFIISFVSYALISIFMNKIIDLWFLHNEMAETVWTLLPGVILVLIGLPSLKALYLSDEVLSPALTIKSIGHQWYWSYEYSDFGSVEFDSYLLNQEDSLDKPLFRLLDVDNRMVIPKGVSVRMVTTSTDVIHSWAVPSLGVKMDANPGRLNQFSLESNRLGLFYGQCSEICGAYHSFMPICVEVVPLDAFQKWLSKFSSM